MIFHENRLLADDSHEISYLIFFGKLLQNLLSAAVVIGTLRVNFWKNMLAWSCFNWQERNWIHSEHT